MTDTTQGNTYVVTRDDLFVEFFFERDGLTYASGQNKLGVKVRLPLDVPLCGYCDTPVASDGHCESCDVLHLDVKALGNGRWQVAA